MQNSLKQFLDNEFGPDLHERQLYKCAQAFRSFDSDKSGKLSLVEFKSVLSSLGFTAPKSQLDQVFDYYDTEKDKKISYTEFIEQVLGINMDSADPNSILERVRTPFSELHALTLSNIGSGGNPGSK